MNRKSITRAEMKSLINYCVNILSIPYESIIEAGAYAILKHIDLDMRETFSMVCGQGFKGKIALNLARLLLSRGKKVSIFLCKSDQGDKEFFEKLSLAKLLGANVYSLDTIGDLEAFNGNLSLSNTIIDAIMDLDYDDAFLGSFDYIIETINKSRIYTISIDVPSGMDSDSGKVNTCHVEADLIIGLQYVKIGLTKTSKLMGTNLALEHVGIPLMIEEKILEK